MAKRKKGRSGETRADRSSSPPVNETVWSHALWIAGAVVTFWGFGFTVMRGSDLWWHIASGRWTFTHHTVPLTDPFSYTALGKRWVVDAWLSDLVFYVWSRWFGMATLVWWKWGVIVATFLIVLLVVRRVSGGRWLGGYLACVLGGAVAAPFLDIRPNIVSMLCYAVLLWLVVGRERPSWGVVPLFLVWVNLHAGFTLGLLVLPFLLAPSFFAPEQRRRTIILFVLSVGVCLINPNGLAVFTQPILYALQTDSPFHTIGEWLPPFKPGGIQSPLYPVGIAAFILGFMIFVSIPKEDDRPRSTWPAVAIGMITLLMSLTSRRFVPIFGMTFPLLVGPLLSRFRWRRRAIAPPWLAPAAAILFGAILILPYPLSSHSFLYMTAEYTFPVDTMDFVETNHLEGKLFSYFNWGGYVHLRTAGEMKVFIDGRASALFSDETYLDYLKVLSASGQTMRIIDESGARFILWPKNERRTLQVIARSPDWQVLYQDYASILFVRKDRPVAITLPPPDSPYHQVSAAAAAFQRGRFDVAEARFRKALEGMPWLRIACNGLEQTLERQGEMIQSGKVEKQCREIFPLEGRLAWYRSVL